MCVCVCARSCSGSGDWLCQRLSKFNCVGVAVYFFLRIAKTRSAVLRSLRCALSSLDFVHFRGYARRTAVHNREWCALYGFMHAPVAAARARTHKTSMVGRCQPLKEFGPILRHDCTIKLLIASRAFCPPQIVPFCCCQTLHTANYINTVTTIPIIYSSDNVQRG